MYIELGKTKTEQKNPQKPSAIHFVRSLFHIGLINAKDKYLPSREKKQVTSLKEKSNNLELAIQQKH